MTSIQICGLCGLYYSIFEYPVIAQIVIFSFGSMLTHLWHSKSVDLLTCSFLSYTLHWEDALALGDLYAKKAGNYDQVQRYNQMLCQ